MALGGRPKRCMARRESAVSLKATQKTPMFVRAELPSSVLVAHATDGPARDLYTAFRCLLLNCSTRARPFCADPAAVHTPVRAARRCGVPELPEVETTRRQIEPLVVGKRIERIEHDSPHRYVNTHLAHDRIIRGISRRGKYLIMHLNGNGEPLELIVHLGMTGGFRPQPGRHTRVTLHLEGDAALYFQDSRRFGRWAVIPAGAYASMPTLSNMGPEPLTDDFDETAFVTAALTAPAVKPWLLSQIPVAGVGNIYADESLWRAGIHPAQTRLTREEARRLHAAIRDVLAQAVIAGGSTLSDNSYAQPDGTPGYFQVQHSVYAREGHPCPRCGQTIEKTVLGQRGTHYCPQCQRVRPPGEGRS